LLGSQAVANDYESRGVKVFAMNQVSGFGFLCRIINKQMFGLQFDMTAWVKAGTREEFGIVVDFVDPEYVVPAFLPILNA
jgi:bacterial leucyl aminopeptidase